MVAWTVNLTVGALTWTIHKGDVPTVSAVNVADGLTVGWQMPDAAGLWPTQPDPTTLQFTLVMPSASQVSGIDRGTTVKLDVFAGATDPTNSGAALPSVRFRGKISDLTGRPIKHPGGTGGNGWRLDIVAVDWVADLAQANVRGSYPLQGIAVEGWVNGMFSLGDLAYPDWTDGGAGSQVGATANGEIPGGTVLEAVNTLLTGYADAGTVTGTGANESDHALFDSQGWRRGIVATKVDGSGNVDATAPYMIDFVSRRNVYATATAPTLPGKFANVAGVYTVTMVKPPATIGGSPVVDFSVNLPAGYVDWDATWSRTRRAAPTRCYVTCRDDITAGAAPGQAWSKVNRSRLRVTNEPEAVAQVDAVALTQIDDARHVGDMYLSDPDGPDAIWQADGLVWHASRDPQWPIPRSFFPSGVPGTSGVPKPWCGYSAPIVVSGIPAAQRPNPGTLYTGTLSGADWTFDGGEFDIALTLDPRTPRSGSATASGDTARWNELATGSHLFGFNPTYTQLDSALTWLGIRLARSSRSDY